MTEKKKQILVTSALPYANGAIHLGHMLEYIQTDIWVRFQRSQGHECYFAWADDAHGTPIMLSARAEGTTPEELIDRMNEEHKTDFRDFGISFDNTANLTGSRSSSFTKDSTRVVTSSAATSSSYTMKKKGCSCLIVSSGAPAPSAVLKTSMATVASPAAVPIRQPTCSIHAQRSPAVNRYSGNRNIILSCCPNLSSH
jgi:hypothetical protein